MPNRRHPPTVSAALRGVAAWVLVLAVVWAQSLGQWHRVLHAPGLARIAAGAAAEPAHDHPDGVHGAFAHLFDTDGHAAACVLYDQLAHGDAAPSVPVVWLPPVWVAAVPPWEGRWQIAAQAVGFLARGPPAAG